MGIDTTGLVVDPSRPTSTATRIVGGGVQVVQQQIVRVDRIVSEPVVGSARDELLRAVGQALRSSTGVILSDYEHGVIDPDTIALCLEYAARAALVSTVDAHGDLFRFRGVTLATPNQPEAQAAVGRTLEDDEGLRAACRQLLDGMAATGILITRGALGLVALDDNDVFTVLPAHHLAEVRDATSARDTVASVATLVRCAGGTVAEAAAMGNAAAALVVRHYGAATVTQQSLAAALAGIAGEERTAGTGSANAG
jgi:rfaE bifunctional protein kinase chain/domain